MAAGKIYLLLAILVLAFCYHISIIFTIKSMLEQMEKNIIERPENREPVFPITEAVPAAALLVVVLFLTALLIL